MKELLISLDTKCKMPLYEQIYQFIRDEIQERQILPGERLPSTRALSNQLQVSRSTVDLAYDQLVSEGYIEAIPYKGYYACEIEGLYKVHDAQEKKITRKNKEAEYRYDFAVNGIDPTAFPHNMWRKISKDVWQDDRYALYHLGESQGEWELREAVANYLHHARGVCCDPDRIVIGAGNDYLLMLIMVLLGDNRIIAMEDPTYKNAYTVFRNLDYTVIGTEMDDHGMCMDSLQRSGADLAYVMPSHQFPTGTVMTAKRRMQLLSWASEKPGRYIIEDDYDSEFRYRGKPIPALQGYDQKGTVIYMGTFSNSLAPSMRISYMVLPESLQNVYQKKGAAFSATVSRFDQKMIEIFLREGHFERHLNRMRAVYKSKHDLFLAKMKQLSSICTVTGENAGIHVLVRLLNGMSEARAVQLAQQNGIKVYGLSKYYIKPFKAEDSDGVLMGYGTMSEQQISEGLEVLREIWENETEKR